MKKPLVILTGPTAVGKTELSIRLSQEIKGSVLSADSMQVYRHLDIGSAKIKPEERKEIPHYMIDVLEPWEEFHVVRFQEMAKQCLEEIYRAGRIPIVTGGTGFYIQALLYDIDFIQEKQDDSYRKELAYIADSQGTEALHRMLERVDEKAALEIHANNVKRVIRALEFHHLTGQKISEHNAREHDRKSPYAFAYFVLNDERKKLYDRIDLRVDQMLDEGLVDEVRKLKQKGCDPSMVSMQGLGYKEILDFLEGNCDLEDAVYRIKRDSRHFAKRQLTWFRRERDVIWMDKPEFDYNIEKMLDFMKQKMTEAQITLQ